jgi:hypothetical protein
MAFCEPPPTAWSAREASASSVEASERSTGPKYSVSGVE